MSRWKTASLAAAIVILFLVANRGAYKGYFQDDDLDNLFWTPHVDTIDYLTGLVSPVFSRKNFRPVWCGIQLSSLPIRSAEQIVN